MPLFVGERLGPYEILALVGKGGMGEVYRAHDSRLSRNVAIKVSNAQFTERFTREARTIASLNHTNICHLYDVGPNYLVMEYVEGQDLRGPVEFDDALPIIQQLIDGIEAAHEKNIIHRDLKPANIKITPEGVVKILDFGLAKAMEPPPSSEGNPENSPTLAMGATEAGTILGTAAYMAPEQAKGKAADKRSDIWSFGVVLYEVLTGNKLFSGESAVEILGCVLNKDPDISAAPVRVHKLLRWCLEKDRKLRLQAIGDARRLLSESAETGATHLAPPPPSRLGKLPWIAAGALAVVAVVALAALWRSTRPVDRPLLRMSVDLGPDAVSSAGITVAISPDGTRLIFPVRDKDGKQQLATRLLNQTAASVLPGTEDAYDPFFSPDGQWVGFFADSKMKKISVLGGAPVALCDAPSGRGATWGQDGNIIAALNGSFAGLSRIPAGGGTPQRLTATGAASGTTHRWPQILPGDEAVLFTVSSSLTNFQYATVDVLSPRTGQRKTLVRDAYFGRYFSDGRRGYLIYIHDGALFASPFDPAKLELLGMPALLLGDLAGDPASGAGQFDFSRTGTFVYRNGKAPDQIWPVEWLGSSGKTSRLLAMPAAYVSPRFSPDGQRLALAVGLGRGRDIFVYDWQRDNMLRLSFAAQGNLPSYPVWMPDGKHIAYRSAPSSGGSGIEWLRSDGSSVGQLLRESKNSMVPYSFSPDGRLLAYYEQTSETGWDIWTMQLDLTDPDHPKAGKPDLFLGTPAHERSPSFSPNGRWMAYQSDDSGRDEIYVRAFPAAGGRWQISSSGGTNPMWSRTGLELFYQGLDNRIMVADYSVAADSFTPDKPRLWANTQIRSTGGVANVDLAPDGKRFAIFPVPEAPIERASVHMMFLLNFFDEARRLLPDK